MLSNESLSPQNTMRAQCCQFIPKEQIDGLLTRTRILRSANPSSASAFSSGLIDPCTFTASGMSLASMPASSFRPHHRIHGSSGSAVASRAVSSHLASMVDLRTAARPPTPPRSVANNWPSGTTSTGSRCGVTS